MLLYPRTLKEWENFNSNKLHFEFTDKNYADEIKKAADECLDSWASTYSAAVIGKVIFLIFINLYCMKSSKLI